MGLLVEEELTPDGPFARDLCAEEPACREKPLCNLACPYGEGSKQREFQR